MFFLCVLSVYLWSVVCFSVIWSVICMCVVYVCVKHDGVSLWVTEAEVPWRARWTSSTLPRRSPRPAPDWTNSPRRSQSRQDCPLDNITHRHITYHITDSSHHRFISDITDWTNSPRRSQSRQDRPHIVYIDTLYITLHSSHHRFISDITDWTNSPRRSQSRQDCPLDNITHSLHRHVTYHITDSWHHDTVSHHRFISDITDLLLTLLRTSYCVWLVGCCLVYLQKYLAWAV